jgi:hypothetical protein
MNTVSFVVEGHAAPLGLGKPGPELGERQSAAQVKRTPALEQDTPKACHPSRSLAKASGNRRDSGAVHEPSSTI